jgi:methionyl-tRNA formyltransferase
MRLVFMGTPDFSVTVLKALIAAGHDIACVYAQPPRPAGRGMALRPTPVHAFAETLGLLVRTPTSLKSVEEQERFAAQKADAAVVVAYGLLLPKAILEAPLQGCFNVHASLLPRWRGAAPIQRAIMAGDDVTGVTIMRMDEGLDTGPMLLTKTCAISDATTAASLHDAAQKRWLRCCLSLLKRARFKTAPTQAMPRKLTRRKRTLMFQNQRTRCCGISMGSRHFLALG